MVYDMPARAKAFGTQKRQRQMDRARQYIAQVGPRVVPSAGPPCFLDAELRYLNDDHGDPANIFPDQMVFLEQMCARPPPRPAHDSRFHRRLHRSGIALSASPAAARPD
ncbi:hypothetical protein MBOT_00370 [Mycobacterium botniense]|uniref:Uncharacterized protein n=1 Tax=Mycobacterium botniense TaxID=84962 RepID=A0A7I9XRP4_9MYCO|nr:hypothetical protein MBOT_00370 [Mycobacterium botniense]